MVKLYARESNSREAADLLDECGSPLLFTGLHEAELANALRLKQRRGELTDYELHHAMRLVESDLNAGLLTRPTLDWPAVWKTCRELSGHHAVATGCRTLDALHVAAAIVLGARTFVSFDVRQRNLAGRAGLKLRPAKR